MTHLNDAELVRYVDGEYGTDEERQWRRHVEACHRCTTDVATIRDQSRLLSDGLARADFEADLAPDPPEIVPVPQAASLAPAAADPHRPGPEPTRAAMTWLKAAAVVLLVAAPLAAIPGVRTWVVERIGGPATSEVTGAAAPLEAGPVVRFSPAPGTFAVRFEAADPGTRLVLARAAGAEAVFRFTGTAEPVVSPASLRIRGGEPGASYRLALPSPVQAVDVTVAGRVIRVTGAELDRGREVPLD